MEKELSDLKNIKGLGEKNIAYLKNLNIYNTKDLLMHYPFKYNLIKYSNINEVKDGDTVIIEGIIESIPLLKRVNIKMNMLIFRVSSKSKIFNAVIYNRAFMKRNFTLGKTVTLFGKWNEKKNMLVANNIIFNKIEEGTIESVYHLTNGINNKSMSKYIENALNQNMIVEDLVPDYLNEKYKLITKMDAIYKIHKPNNQNDIKKAKLKLIYEELFEFMFKMNYLKKINKNINKRKIRKVDKIQW